MTGHIADSLPKDVLLPSPDGVLGMVLQELFDDPEAVLQGVESPGQITGPLQHQTPTAHSHRQEGSTFGTGPSFCPFTGDLEGTAERLARLNRVQHFVDVA